MSFLLLLPLSAIAQEDYLSLLSGDRVWTMKYDIVSYPVGAVRFSETILRGDTVINGIKYMQMWYRDWAEGESKPEQWRTKNNFLGQENGKLYLWHDSVIEPYSELIMDFSATAGDIVKVRDHYIVESVEYLVESVSDTIIRNSDDASMRRCLYLQGVRYKANELWIEGVGSLKYGIEGDMLLTGGSRPTLIKCSDGGKVLYQHSDYNLSVDNLSTESEPQQSYDLQGRRVNKTSCSGIYIQEGRKWVVR